MQNSLGRESWNRRERRRESNLWGRRKVYRDQHWALKSSTYPKNNGLSLNDLKQWGGIIRLTLWKDYTGRCLGKGWIWSRKVVVHMSLVDTRDPWEPTYAVCSRALISHPGKKEFPSTRQGSCRFLVSNKNEVVMQRREKHTVAKKKLYALNLPLNHYKL